ncbi:MAG TPA: hypothetical protein VG714_01290 [Acidobacteriaceae bacterium]|nr:hypothetical protein [Acidobacteriaceae bacterium]
MTNNEAEASTSGLDAQQRLQVEAELKRILESPAFRTSKRSQEFLRYIVATYLEGKADELKERAIGIQVFQRMPDYDTGEHSIVRVKANELRKRLAQVYSEPDEQWVVQIHLPKGSYTPQFRWREASSDAAAVAAAEEPERSGWTWVRAAWIAAALAVVCGATWYFVRSQLPPDTAEQFWRPILDDHNPLLLCTGSPEIWRLNAPVEDESKLPSSIQPSDITRDVDHYVGWGDAAALSDLAAYFAQHDKNVTVQLADDVSFSELSHSPVVLVGARSNSWSMQLANNMRFVFMRTGPTSVVRDRKTGKEWSYQPGNPAVDYVILSRIFESKTGRMVVLAAGLSHYGTEAAGQVLTNSREMQKLLEGAPKDWATRDLQLVLRVEVFGRTAGTPTLVASDFP